MRVSAMLSENSIASVIVLPPTPIFISLQQFWFTWSDVLRLAKPCWEWCGNDREEQDMSDLTKSAFEEMFVTEEDAELTLADMQAEVREVNELNGWFDEDRPFSADIALLHSEVSELHEAFVNNDPENVAEEFADIFIRLLDTAERTGIDLSGSVSIAHGAETMFTPSPLSLHQFISRAYEAYRKHGLGEPGVPLGRAKIENELKCLLSLVMSGAAILDIDLVAEFDKKMARNRERGYRHGGKVE